MIVTVDNCHKEKYKEQSINYNEVEQQTWKILIVDDDTAVHSLTKVILGDFSYENKELEIYDAFSEDEAQDILREHSDIAVVLLDVVMENNDSGLNLVKYIRNKLKNMKIRILLRTGILGEFPGKKVIVDYDINDYRLKSEITPENLFINMVTSIRAYNDIQSLNLNRVVLEKVIESSAQMFKKNDLKEFVRGVLYQLTAILETDKYGERCKTSGVTLLPRENSFIIESGTGDYARMGEQKIDDVMDKVTYKKIKKSIDAKKSLFLEDSFMVFLESETQITNTIIMYVKLNNKITEWDRDIIEVFCSNVVIAYDNICLGKEIESTQKEIIFTLGEIAEARSRETGYHVKRVAEYSRLLAIKYGLPHDECELIGLASPMHDIGKLAIPDAVLNKPGKLTYEEFEIMKTHSAIGHDMVKNSNRAIMKAAAIIALQHHEKYNGKGYPFGHKGESIHIYGRITAMADVFDALGSDRTYKRSWELDRILNLFKEEKGEHFDPRLIEIFFENLDDILKIRNAFPDKYRGK